MTKPVALGHFVGPAVHSHARGGVNVHESNLSTGLVVPPHVHDRSIISVILRGVAVEQVGRRVRDIVTQDFLFTPAFEMHSYRVRDAGRWMNMEFSNEWLEAHMQAATPLPETSLLFRSDTALTWASRVRREVRAPDAVSGVAIDGALILMLAEMTRIRLNAARTRPRWLSMVEDALEASISSPPTVEQLAAMAGVHPGHLLKTFRRYHGATIANFVRQRRVEHARAELLRATKPISVIALEAGFADQSHFTRAFRQAFGETPGQYVRATRSR